MAQSVERHIGNVEVTGSIPVTSLRKSFLALPFFLPLNVEFDKKYDF